MSLKLISSCVALLLFLELIVVVLQVKYGSGHPGVHLVS